MAQKTSALLPEQSKFNSQEIVPEFNDFDELEEWVWEWTKSGKAANSLSELHPRIFTKCYSGMTIAEYNKKVEAEYKG